MSNLTLLRRPEPVDFFTILRDLKYVGHGGNAVAFALGLPESTVRSWKSGIMPGYEDGRALITLYEQVLRRTPPTKAASSMPHLICV